MKSNFLPQNSGTHRGVHGLVSLSKSATRLENVVGLCRPWQIAPNCVIWSTMQLQWSQRARCWHTNVRNAAFFPQFFRICGGNLQKKVNIVMFWVTKRKSYSGRSSGKLILMLLHNIHRWLRSQIDNLILWLWHTIQVHALMQFVSVLWHLMLHLHARQTWHALLRTQMMIQELWRIHGCLWVHHLLLFIRARHSRATAWHGAKRILMAATLLLLQQIRVVRVDRQTVLPFVLILW